ncbi:MAG: RNA methyltransferase [Phototrophicaceae bacterium]
MLHYQIEIEVPKGLEDIAKQELHALYSDRISHLEIQPAALRFNYTGNLGGLLALQTVYSVYEVLSFDIPRPKALLGHQYFTHLVGNIQAIIDLHPKEMFHTLHIAAAGSQSTVMKRLLHELAEATGLVADYKQGDLLLRLRPNRHQTTWEALLRISARPNATRSWRAADYKGALNGAVARAMVYLSNPSPYDHILNLCCGSGSLAIERALHMPFQVIDACDNDIEVLEKAAENISTLPKGNTINLHYWDATNLPVDHSTYNVFLVDLPFGNLTGTHNENVTLYPKLFNEMARVALPEARAVVISHELKLLESVLNHTQGWHVVGNRQIQLRGLNPAIYILSHSR